MKKVYEPSEDTYLLIESMKPKGKTLEIGCGSGIVSLEAYKKGAKEIYCGDINPYAIIETKKLLKKNGIIATVKLSFLFESFKGIKFDTILFNPPYVISEEGEDSFSYLEFSWNGGKNGRKWLDLFLNEFDKYLEKNGKVYIIHPDYCDLEKTKKILKEKGFHFKIIGEKKLFFETLYCLEISKSS